MISTLEKVYLVYKPVFTLYNKQKVLNRYSSIDILFDYFYQKIFEETNSLLMWLYFNIFWNADAFPLRGEQ